MSSVLRSTKGAGSHANKATNAAPFTNNHTNEDIAATAAALAGECPISYVQLSGLVVMKIIKHCNDESSMNISQGVLLGLVVDKCLEITNCFAIPANKTNDENYDDVSYQLAVMHRWKSMNVDNFHVGWYQSSDIGSCLSLNLLESQYLYQTNIEESVVIVYDTIKSSKGFLNITAYRLTPQAIRMYKENNFGTEVLKTLKVSYEKLFMEIPIVIKNSILTNIMMSELGDLVPEEQGNSFLDLGVASVLEGDIKSLIMYMDDLYPEILRYNRYQQIVMKQETEKSRALAKQTAENLARAYRGESPISDEDILKQFRPIPAPQRLSALIASGQINDCAQHMSQICSQSLAKLFISECLQKAKDSCSKDSSK